jgi:plastocyanin
MATRLTRPLSDGDIVLRLAVVALTLGTAYIHLTLGGLLFTLTAFGYGLFAVALVVPLALADRFRWLIRLGLIAYTLSVIAGWVLDWPRYDVAYMTKAIELVLVALLAIDLGRRSSIVRRLLSLVVLTASISLLAACSASAGGQTAQSSVGPNAVRISAKDLAFSTKTLSATANTAFQIAFDNQEGAPHNVAIYRDSSAKEKIFGADPVSGPKVVVYDVPALAAGTYFFRCDVHPDMSGQLTVR